ncbi:MAG TPA: murein biosynthesis integral membrane protein MurJ [Polyangiaceae bacterium]|nr:murein biosynthesis integral membrane protein MurJ [Polyangiaceae bacterium]
MSGTSGRGEGAEGGGTKGAGGEGDRAEGREAPGAQGDAESGAGGAVSAGAGAEASATAPAAGPEGAADAAATAGVAASVAATAGASASAVAAGAGEGAARAAGAEGERRAIARRAGVVGAGTLASRVLGLGRDMAMTAVYPVAATDAFWVAFLLPNMLRQLLAEGAVSSSVVPVLAEARERGGEAQAKAFFANIRGLSLVLTALVTAAGVAAAPLLVDLFAHGLRARPGQFERAVALTRWVFPYVLFMNAAALGMAALHTHRRFAVAAVAPALLNVAFLVTTFALAGPLERAGLDPALALVWGALLGGALQAAAQLPSLRAIGYLGRPGFDARDPRVRLVLARLAPMTLGLGVYYVDLVVCRRLLSELGEGAQSYFSWAQRLCDFPQGIFTMALQAATLPSLASLAAQGDRRELAKTSAYALRLSLFVALPVSALLVALSGPVVVALFQRGAFRAGDAAETARALAAQGTAVWAVAAVRQLVAVYFALGDTRTPVVVSIVDLGALVAIAWALVPAYGHVGVSLAVAGSSLVQLLGLALWLARKLPPGSWSEVARSAGRTALASAFAALGGWGAATWAQAVSPPTALGRLVPAALGGSAFGALFLLAAWGLKSPELEPLAAGLRRRLGRRAGR